MAAMDRIRSFFRKREDGQEYQPLNDESQSIEGPPERSETDIIPFSWVEYGIFALLGVAMLWAWYGRLSQAFTRRCVS